MKRFGFGKKEKAEEPNGFPKAPPAPPIQHYKPSASSQQQQYQPQQQQQQQRNVNPYATPPPQGGNGGGYGEKQYGGYKQQEADEDSNRGALFGNRPAQQGQEGRRSPAPSYHSTAPSYNSGGAGGYGGAPQDPNRDQLFGNRAARGGPPAPAGYGAAPAPAQGGYGAPSPQPHNGAGAAGGDDDNEDEDVDAIKQQIRFTKQESVNSTRRALAAAAQAEETGRNTLMRLGAQGERLTNTKKNLDLANNQNKKAEQTTDELRTLNRSMFAVHVGNPFNSARRAQAEEDKIMDRHAQEMAERDRVRAAGYEGKKNVEQGLKAGGAGGYGGGASSGYGKSTMSNAERSKYQFEADESDDEKEKEIEHNLDQIGNVVGRLKNLAMATNKEVDRQIVQIEEVSRSSDKVEFGIAKNTHKLRKFQ
ncbi:V-SNARE protein [Peziza echinospora]|nr:V-SNARE protein [Peziza echinospora]